MKDFFELSTLTSILPVPTKEVSKATPFDRIIAPRLPRANNIRLISLESDFSEEYLVVHDLAHYRRAMPVFTLQQNIPCALDFLLHEELINVKDMMEDYV